MNRIKDAGKRIAADLRAYGQGILLAAAYLGATGLLGIPVCPMVLLTGLPCPGCGMTRAALLFLKGHWLQAFWMHPFFYVLLALATAAFILRYAAGRSITGMRWIVSVTLFLSIVFYIYRMMRYFPDREPMVYVPRNILRFSNMLSHKYL